jgi:hypothetical protein
MTMSERAVRLRRSTQQPIDWLRTSDWSLTILLIFLGVSVFIVRPLAAVGWDERLIASLVFSSILISGVITVSHSRVLALVFGAVAIITVAVHWARFLIFGPSWVPVDAACSMLSIGVLAFIVLAHVFREGPITIHRIQGAVAVYLLVAIMFAAAYTVIDFTVPNAFQGVPPLSELHNDPTQRFVYFSFITLTTVGYGDVTPVAPVACSLAMLEALLGQLFPAILIARLVSMEMYYRQRRFEREQAELDREALASEVARRLREGSDRS